MKCLAHGMLIVVQATDSTFGAKLRENLHSNGRFRFDPKKPTDDFVVEHYAGPVTYSCTKFLDKNKDTLSTGSLTRPSACPFLQAFQATHDAATNLRQMAEAAVSRDPSHCLHSCTSVHTLKSNENAQVVCNTPPTSPGVAAFTLAACKYAQQRHCMALQVFIL